MSVERVKATIDDLANKVEMYRGRGEASTGMGLVLPFLTALGYNVFDISEVAPEYDGDFAMKKAGQKEKVDYALIFGGMPRVFIEVKPVDFLLDGHEGQLARYFNAVTSVSLGVLTNGQEYRFFTDTNAPNIMDHRPFFVFRLDQLDPRLDVLIRFSKPAFDADAIRDFAMDLIHTAAIVSFLRGELDLRGKPPSDAFVRWILSEGQVYEGRVVASVVERFKPIVATAVATVLREVARRAQMAFEKGVTEPEPVEPVVAADTNSGSVVESAGGDADDGAGDAGKRSVVTTQRELDAYAIVEQLVREAGILGRTMVDPSSRRELTPEIAFKDTTGYFGVYFNKPSWWFVRLFMENRQPWVGFNADASEIRKLLPDGASLVEGHAFAPIGVRVYGPEDLRGLAAAIVYAASAAVEARQ